MTFLNKYIEHDVPEEVKAWIKEEIAAQEVRFARIEREMEDLAGQRELWYQEFFDRITTMGFNMDGDDKIKLQPGQLPVKPEGCEDRVVWEHGVDSDPALKDRD
ncbi:hypothetical protein F0M18_06265 [Pseudohalioglobus sediminis]|uniref:Uncharacterized protein n=1 Tax=Pseudohalioglobus sediminis TaxID=2606449 RepID=A0A5B0X2G1_9GAMM|nr:hypothetical protein [Pseudohalioglobus sediminis]KAA1193436.1 hypothetical protein F0M18_06265 [Pseudohalioglobus sediminis]